MKRSVAEKLGIKEGTRNFLVHAPADVVETMSLPELDLHDRCEGEYGYIHVFVRCKQDLEQEFSHLKEHLEVTGMLWVSWPKGHKLGTDLTLAVVIEVGYRHGLVESTVVSINETWSAIKFTHPKPGKTYHNSYGTLPNS